MKKFGCIALLVGFLLLPHPGYPANVTDDITVSGEVGVIGRVVDGEDESAKFEEYRDIPEPVSGDIWLRLDKSNDYFFEVVATDIAEDDQYVDFLGDWYGKLKVNINYNRIPHRFTYDALSLYNGFGSDKLALNNAIQVDLQETAVSDIPTSVGNFFQGAQKHDLEIFRDKGELNVDLVALPPFNLRLELKREERDGERPFFGSFGFSNTVEIPAPIDYKTTEARLIAEYAKSSLYLKASYYLSVFDNDNDTLIWDNYFRALDSTSPIAYLGPINSNDGPERGLIDLVPNNIFHQVALSGSYTGLPLKTRISATASWGLMKQNDDLVPFTTNTAIVPGAANAPPFDASDPANLPADEVDAEVDTYLLNVLLTSRPMSFMHAKAKFRYYEYDNDTDEIPFVGHVRTDAVWESGEPGVNLPTGYEKLTTGLDLGFDVYRNTLLSAGYMYERTNRDNREVDKQDDHIFKGSVDINPFFWLDLKGSYERTERDISSYDFTIPFTPFEEDPSQPSGQLPFIRKYLQADVVRDQLNFLATVYPIASLAVSGSFTYGMDDYEDSPFGLLDDKHYIASLDADYGIADRFNVSTSYSYEKYDYEQRARQWTPGGIGNPFTDDTGLQSLSNWEADGEDIVNTVTAELNWAIIPDKLDSDLSYSYSEVNGEIDFFSPLGTAVDDANPFIPIGWGAVDETRLHTLHAKIKYRLWKSLSCTLGYMYEKFDFDDFEKQGFTNIPTDATGTFNGAILMNTLIKDYDVHVLYTKLSYRF